MKQVIRHRRLYAFYNSKVLNALLVLMVVTVLFMDYTGYVLLPSVCCAVESVGFAGYALWFWIKKPARIVVNKFLSDVSYWFVLYFLIVTAMKGANVWWYIFPVVAAIALFFITLLKNHDSNFEI